MCITKLEYIKDHDDAKIEGNITTSKIIKIINLLISNLQVNCKFNIVIHYVKLYLHDSNDSLDKKRGVYNPKYAKNKHKSVKSNANAYSNNVDNLVTHHDLSDDTIRDYSSSLLKIINRMNKLTPSTILNKKQYDKFINLTSGIVACLK